MTARIAVDIERMATRPRLEAMARRPPERPMARRHFRCDDCGVWCECTGDARLLPHNRCGLAAERS
jgi:hypothetical protein